jgi:hypothetical protein
MDTQTRPAVIIAISAIPAGILISAVAASPLAAWIAIVFCLALGGIIWAWEKPAAGSHHIKGPQPLEDLFKNDFSVMKLFNEVTITFENGSQSRYIQQVYQDYDANTEFAGFYLPRSGHAFEIARWLASNFRGEYNKLRAGVKIASKSPGDMESIHSDVLTFSGRVYLYHEDDLTLRQAADLVDDYKTHGMHLMLRGQQYATQTWLQQRP